MFRRNGWPQMTKADGFTGRVEPIFRATASNFRCQCYVFIRYGTYGTPLRLIRLKQAGKSWWAKDAFDKISMTSLTLLVFAVVRAYRSTLWYKLIPCPRKDERLSRPSSLTYSRRFTHISGHPSAVGRAQDRESSPVRDRRSTTVPRRQVR